VQRLVAIAGAAACFGEGEARCGIAAADRLFQAGLGEGPGEGQGRKTLTGCGS
jgi:hypothetical protein